MNVFVSVLAGQGVAHLLELCGIGGIVPSIMACVAAGVISVLLSIWRKK